MTSKVRAVSLGEEQSQGLDDPGAAKVTDPTRCALETAASRMSCRGALTKRAQVV